MLVDHHISGAEIDEIRHISEDSGWETATFATADEGPYTVQCQLDDRYSGTLSVWPMGQVGDADGDGEVDQGADGFAFTPLTIGLIVGAVGLVLVIVGIVLLVRASGRRHDLGM